MRDKSRFCGRLMELILTLLVRVEYTVLLGAFSFAAFCSYGQPFLSVRIVPLAQLSFRMIMQPFFFLSEEDVLAHSSAHKDILPRFNIL